ncbi:carboxylesterase [Pseudoxanthomonas sp. SGNA-20]|jgi:Predicted esterase|uniref:alpha/beta hydrolase n=1 Tax=Pseudoxanthomonas sp. SGNA-20 TaxID=2493088 RepID=UPI000F642B19|nr:dienelactone hydrolase family protein [Pseudoxanthomonas sp. SGNA-20]RRN59167.1 carboxylesterase [Pseudoxanthomonas sp. SGNA-20]
MLLQTVEQETGANPQWTVLWLHGLGADGHDFAPIVPELVRPHWPALRFVFPHAPVRPVTINGGVPMRAWYDIVGMDFATRADAAGVEESIEQVEALIAREAERGIPASRLLLAGFSQGGAITLATGLRRREPLAGLVALSTYLPGGTAAAAAREPNAVAQPVFFAHGSADPVVAFQHGQASARALEQAGFEVEWHHYPMAHQVCAQEIADLGDWLERRFR